MNALIQIDAEHLHIPTRTIEARFAASCSVKITHAPNDVSDVYIRVFETSGDGYFDCPANQDDNGDWDCYIIGTCFPAAGESLYEVRGTDSNGNLTALGRGKLIIDKFSAGGVVASGSEITVTELPDASGTMHRVVAVNLGTVENPDWTWQIADTVESPAVALVADANGAVHQVRATTVGDETVVDTGLVQA